MTPCWTDLELASLLLGSDDLGSDDSANGDEGISPLAVAARSHGDECRSCAAALARARSALEGLESLDESEVDMAPAPLAVWEQIAARLQAPAAAVRLAPGIKIACTYCKGKLEGRARHCGACLGPHHDDCWEEHGRCAACGAKHFVRAEGSQGTHRRRERWRSAALVLTGALVGVGAAALVARPSDRPSSLEIGPPRPPAVLESPKPPTPGPRPTPVGLASPKLPTPGARPRGPRSGQRFAKLAPSGPYRVGRNSQVLEPTTVETPLTFDELTNTFVAVSREGEATAFDLSGRQLWRVRVGEYGDPTPGAVIAGGQQVVVAGCDGKVQAINLRSGIVQWSQQLRSPINQPPSVAPGGELVVVATSDGDVVALDLRDGHTRWVDEVEPLARPPLVLATPRQQIVCVATRSAMLLTIDAESGKRLGIYATGSAVTAGPVAWGQRVYAGTADGQLIVVDVPLGARTANAGVAFGSPILDIVPTGDDSAVVSSAGELHFLDTHLTPRAVHMSADEICGLVFGRHLYVVSKDGSVVARDPLNGREIWTGSFRAPEAELLQIQGCPVLAGDRLCVVGDNDAGVFEISTKEPE